MYSRSNFDMHGEAEPRAASRDMPDPLDPDGPYDVPVVTTRRQLVRLALVATETAARFQREGSEQDPMAWMLASRMLFDGRDAIEAALELPHCTRAILLHGLGLGLDAEPDMIDDLCTDEVATACDIERD